MSATTAAPSPIAAPTRFTELERTSPTANTPDATQNERAHQPLAEIRFGDDKRAKLLRRNEQSLDVRRADGLARQSAGPDVKLKRPAAMTLPRVAEESGRPVRA